MECLTTHRAAMAANTDAAEDAGANLSETENQIRKLSDAADTAIDNALQNMNITEFLEMSRHLGGGQ